MDRYGPRCFYHYFRLGNAAALDTELARLVGDAYEVGRLEPHRRSRAASIGDPR